MARGNQRDLAREKNLKKQKGKGAAAKDQEGNKVGKRQIAQLTVSLILIDFSFSSLI